jgi:hypothetical protein
LALDMTCGCGRLFRLRVKSGDHGNPQIS